MHELLTARELQVIRLLVAYSGSSKEVARELGVSRFTIRHHRTNAYHKLGVSSFTEALQVLGYLRVPRGHL